MNYPITDGNVWFRVHHNCLRKKNSGQMGRKDNDGLNLKKQDSKSMSVAIMIFIRMTSVMAQSFKTKPPLVMSIRGNRRF